VPPRRRPAPDDGPGPAVSTRLVQAPRRRAPSRAAFTLVELLVVIVIIGVLVALLIPAVAGVRAIAQQSACLNNLRELGLAAQQYVVAHDKYPAAWFEDSSGNVHRWMDYLQPYMVKATEFYHCPSDPNAVPLSYDKTIVLSYGINISRFLDDAHDFWYPVMSYNVEHPGQVILLADCAAGVYYCGIDPPPFQDPVPSVAYRHVGGGFNAVYCDGHAESRTDTTQIDWDASQ